MAKRVATKIKSVQNAKIRTAVAPRTIRDSLSRRLTNLNLSGRSLEISRAVRGVITAPATMYVAGGLGVAVLARFALRYYRSHPEISTFVEEKIDTVEGKLKEYRSSLTASNSSDEATH